MKLPNESHSPVPPERVDEFWAWFQQTAPADSPNSSSKWVRQLDRRLADLGVTSWELGLGWNDPDCRSLSVSPGGDPEQLRITRFIVSRAPAASGWEFHHAKPPKRWHQKFVLESDENIEVDGSGAEYVLFANSNGAFDLLLIDRGLDSLPSPLAEQAAELLVIGEIGEEAFMSRVRTLEIIESVPAKFVDKCTSIRSLRDHLRALSTC